MLAQIYWDGSIPSGIEVGLNIATLAGTVIGQLGFGILADVYGRKRMYGLELLIIVMSTLGVAMSADGASGSMNIAGWLIAWRFFLGIGIGGDYPLSAIITSEFAPTKSRGRMLAAVFFMQPIGYLFATLVSIIALAASKSELSSGTPATCVQIDDCRRALDRVWRWVAGIGAVFALIAIFIRFTIPESPRYTMEVLNRPVEALEDVQDLDLPVAVQSPDPPNDVELQRSPHLGPRDPDPSVPPTFPLSPGQQQLSTPDPGRRRNTSLLSTDTRASVSSTMITNEIAPSVVSWNHFEPNAQEGDVNGGNGDGVEDNDDDDERPKPWDIYYTGLKKHFIYRGYWMTLLGTSLSWACFDFAFYVLGPNSYEVVAWVFNDLQALAPDSDSYTDLMGNSWHSLVVVSIGSMIGGAAMIFLVGRFSPRFIQMIGFLSLTVLFVTVGLCFEFIQRNTSMPLIVFLYVITQILFEIGPNFTTYIIPAELFPTQFRCTAHGVSAAAGKLAAVLAQIFVSFTPIGPYRRSEAGPDWFGYVIIIFAAFMFLGAVVTKYLIPETRKPDGSSRPLEDLQYVGRHYKRQKPRPESVSENPRGESHNVETNPDGIDMHVI